MLFNFELNEIKTNFTIVRGGCRIEAQCFLPTP